MAGIRVRRIPSRCSRSSREVFRADGPFTPLPAILVKLLELGLSILSCLSRFLKAAVQV